MANVLINRITNLVAGVDRQPQPLEIVIEDVYLEGLTKQIPDILQRHKVDPEGNLLYLLPQEPSEIVDEITKTIETTEETGNPIMINVPTQIAIFNEDGSQKQYERTIRGETTEVTEEPVMIKVEQDEEVIEQQKTDEDGNLLYWGQVGTGQMIDCYTVEQILNQKENLEGDPLYYKEVTESITTYEDQEPLEITQDDEQWTEELAPSLEDIEQTKTVKFEDQPSAFDYDEIVETKSLSPIPLTPEQEIDLLKAENATIILESLNKEIQIEALETELSGITLSLVEGGVI